MIQYLNIRKLGCVWSSQVCARKLGRCGRYGRDGSNGGSGGGGGSGHGFVRMARGQKIELTVILCGVHA
mgnify:CR=1 FL=1